MLKQHSFIPCGPPAARSGSIRMPDPPTVAIAAARVAEEDAVVDVGPGAAVAGARVAEEDAVVDVGFGAAIAAGKMKDVGNMRKQELRAFAKSLGVKLWEAGKYRGMVALKEACKAAQSQ